MYGKSYWYGKEVEGRLSDIETVFVRGQLPENYKEYPHAYFIGVAQLSQGSVINKIYSCVFIVLYIDLIIVFHKN